jgi:hypothetical protein
VGDREEGEGSEEDGKERENMMTLKSQFTLDIHGIKVKTAEKAQAGKRAEDMAVVIRASDPQRHYQQIGGSQTLQPSVYLKFMSERANKLSSNGSTDIGYADPSYITLLDGCPVMMWVN